MARATTFGRGLLGAITLVALLGTPGRASARSVPRPGGTYEPPTLAPKPEDPATDPFYAQPPGLDALAPGAIIASRQVAVSQYGYPMPGTAYQLQFRTTDTGGRAVAALTTVLLPSRPYLGRGKRPLLSLQMAIDSLGVRCNPSYALRHGTEKEAATLNNALQAGWVAMTTDFEGPHNAFTAGLMAARATLDGVRAAIAFAPTGLDATSPIGLWGYSGGGQATMWATEQLGSYAPELNVVAVAAGGIPANLRAAADNVDGGPASGLVVGAAFGLAREFPSIGIDGLLNDAGKALKEESKDMCLAQLVSSYPFKSLSTYTTVPNVFDVPQVATVLQASRLPKAIPTVPMFLYHGVADELIPFDVGRSLAVRYCVEGANVRFVADPQGEHITVSIAETPEAMGFLSTYFNGGTVPSTCRADIAASPVTGPPAPYTRA